MCCLSLVGVVSGIGDLARRLPGVVEDGVTDIDDDLVVRVGEWRDGGDDWKRPRVAGTGDG